MSIYVIADLHLSFNENKPMDVFGDNWIGHEEKIRSNWISKVKNDDVVVLPGDFSWSMYLKDTYRDFEYLNNLPGKKILLKGNHDYWWSTLASMRNFINENGFKNIDFLYNNAYEFENCILAGTRGWNLSDDTEEEKIIKRELVRLELSINDGIKRFGNDKEIIIFMHYPPISNAKLVQNEELQFVNIMKKYNVKRCYYGHLHSTSIKDALQGNVAGIEFKLVSADGLDFNLIKIK